MEDITGGDATLWFTLLTNEEPSAPWAHGDQVLAERGQQGSPHDGDFWRATFPGCQGTHCTLGEQKRL